MSVIYLSENQRSFIRSVNTCQMQINRDRDAVEAFSTVLTALVNNPQLIADEAKRDSCIFSITNHLFELGSNIDNAQAQWGDLLTTN